MVDRKVPWKRKRSLGVKQEDRMKKRIAALLLAAALLLLCACSPETSHSGKISQNGSSLADRLQEMTSNPVKDKDPAEEPEEEPPAEEGKTPSEEEKQPEDPEPSKPREVAISELWSEDGTASDSEGTEYTYSYHVPQIEDDTPGAAEINREIESIYGEMAGLGMESVAIGEFPGYSSVTYESFRSGSVLSIVIHTVFYYAYVEECAVYLYDPERGVRLSNSELLAMQGLTEEQLLQAVRSAVTENSARPEFIIWREDEMTSMFADVRERLSWTLARSVSAEVPLYLDDTGTMYAAVSVGTIAGSGIMQEILPVHTEQEEPFRAALDFEQLFSLQSTEQGLTIRFHDTPDTRQLIETNGCMNPPAFETEIPIHGLLLDYTQAQCGYLDSIANPYLFLMTDDGGVGYVDVAAGLQSGYFCASGPVLGLPPVVELNNGLREDGCTTVFAHCENGESLDLLPIVYEERWTKPMAMSGQWSGYFDAGSPYKALLMDSWETIHVTDGKEYQGCASYMGMTEDGMVYAYTLWDPDSGEQCRQGAVALVIDVGENEMGYIRSLSLRELSGTGLICAPGETALLTESFG